MKKLKERRAKEMKELTTCKEWFCYMGGMICLILGIAVLSMGSIPWGIIIGASLVTIAWMLAVEAGESTGKRKRRLEEREEREKREE